MLQHDDTLTTQDIFDLLEKTARQDSDVTNHGPVPNAGFGWGKLDVAALKEEVDPSSPSPPSPIPISPNPGPSGPINAPTSSGGDPPSLVIRGLNGLDALGAQLLGTQEGREYRNPGLRQRLDGHTVRS